MPSSQIIVAGLDPTGFTTISGAQLLQAIQLAVLYADKGMVVTTTDSSGIPQPPNAAVDTFWKAYLWRRLDGNGKSYLYQWDESVVSDATYLKWVSILSTAVPVNSVGTAQLQGNSVTPDKIQAVDFSQILNFPTVMGGDVIGNFPNPIVAANAITGSKVAGGTLTLSNMAGDVLAAIQGNSTPSGIIVPCGMTVAPAGWLLCNGDGVDQTTYATLYAAIGVADNSGGKQFGWPSTTGANATYSGVGTSFKLPDMRGIFMRGANGTAYDNGRAYNTLQAEAYLAHTHANTINIAGLLGYIPYVSGTHVAYTAATGSPDLQKSGTGLALTNASSGGAETRPVNLSLNYIIKT